MIKPFFKNAVIALTCLAATAHASAENLTLDRIYSSPSLSGSTPKSLRFSPDGSRVTYLKGKASDLNRYDLWEYNIASGENKLLVDADDIFSGPENLSDEEKPSRTSTCIWLRYHGVCFFKRRQSITLPSKW